MRETGFSIQFLSRRQTKRRAPRCTPLKTLSLLSLSHPHMHMFSFLPLSISHSVITTPYLPPTFYSFTYFYPTPALLSLSLSITHTHIHTHFCSGVCRQTHEDDRRAEGGGGGLRIQQRRWKVKKGNQLRNCRSEIISTNEKKKSSSLSSVGLKIRFLILSKEPSFETWWWW